jgi:hypothetical protein
LELPRLRHIGIFNIRLWVVWQNFVGYFRLSGSKFDYLIVYHSQKPPSSLPPPSEMASSTSDLAAGREQEQRRLQAQVLKRCLDVQWCPPAHLVRASHSVTAARPPRPRSRSPCFLLNKITCIVLSMHVILFARSSCSLQRTWRKNDDDDDH